MAKLPATLAAFDIGPSGLKFVEMTRDAGQIVSAGRFELAPGRWNDREHLAAQVRSAIDTTARGRVTRVIAAVPLGHAHLRVIATPAEGGEDDARDHVAWDMAHYLARPLDVYAVDAQPLDVTRGEEVLYAAAAFRRVVALAIRDAVEEGSRLPLAALDVDAAALVNALALNYPEAGDASVLLIQAGREGTGLIRARHGRLEGVVYLRDDGALPGFGGADEAQEHAEGLLRRARAIAQYLRQAGEPAPGRVLMAGDLAPDPDFRELVNSHLVGIVEAPPALFNPFRNLSGPPPEEFPDVYPGAPLAAAVGLALRLAGEP